MYAWSNGTDHVSILFHGSNMNGDFYTCQNNEIKHRCLREIIEELVDQDQKETNQESTTKKDSDQEDCDCYPEI